MEEETRCKRDAKKKQVIGRRERVNGFIVRLPTCDALLAVHFAPFLFKNAEYTYERATDVHTRWRPFCVRELTSPDDKPFKEVRGCRETSTFPFHVSLLSFFFLLYTYRVFRRNYRRRYRRIIKFERRFSRYNFQHYEYLS